MANKGSTVKGVFYLFLALIPFQFALNISEGIDVAVGRLVALLLAFFLAGFALKRRSFTISFSTLSLFLFLFFLWSGMSLFWGEDSSAGIRQILFLANFFPLFWLLPNLFNSTSDVESVQRIFLYPSLAVSLVGIGQFTAQFIFGVEGVFQFWAGVAPFIYGDTFSQSILAHSSWLVEVSGQTLFRSIAFFPDPHIFGFYLAFVTPLAFFSKRKLFKAFGIVFVATLLLTFSRQAYIGALAALLGFFLVKLIENLKSKKENLHRKSKILTVIFTFSILLFTLLFTPLGSRFISSFNLQEGSIAGRLENWSQALSLIKENPVFGVGLGNYATALDPLVNQRSPVTAHNLYLDIWAELGIVGLILFLGIALGALKKSFHSSPSIFLIFVWFFTQAMFDTPLFSVHVLPLFIIFLALVDSQQLKDE